MKEIEVKARLKEREKIMANLALRGCVFSPMVTQEDVVYATTLGGAEEYLSSRIFLRLRIKNNSKIIFTLKRPLKDLLDKIEYETEVGSYEQMEKAIFEMGYKKGVRVKKTRITTKYNGCEICIDEVEDLGSFIEMEKMSEDGDSEKIQKELFDFLVSVGVDPNDRVREGYDILMLRK